ncbi:MAG: response regulator transcription factor [Erysipelotrichales bacterium]
MNNILIVDDDKNILEFISIYLKKKGYRITTTSNPLEVIGMIEEGKFDLVVVDIMMPELDGYQLVKSIKEDFDIPVIFLSAKVQLNDKLKGFEVSGDDYITKPFQLEELEARIKALLKRYQKLQSNIIYINEMKIDVLGSRVEINNEYLDFPLKELELLTYLAQHKNKVVSREEIITNIWGYDYEGDERTIDVHIKRIRSKLSESTINIKTIRGLGYSLEDE